MYLHTLSHWTLQPVRRSWILSHFSYLTHARERAHTYTYIHTYIHTCTQHKDMLKVLFFILQCHTTYTCTQHKDMLKVLFFILQCHTTYTCTQHKDMPFLYTHLHTRTYIHTHAHNTNFVTKACSRCYFLYTHSHMSLSEVCRTEWYEEWTCQNYLIFHQCKLDSENESDSRTTIQRMQIMFFKIYL